MEWPAPQPIVPIVLNSARPARNRGRQNSEHPNRQPTYFQDQNGMLMVAGGRPGRASSVSGAYIPPANVIVNNHQWEEHSPTYRRSSYGHDHHYSDDEDWELRPRHHRRHSSRARDSRTPSPYYDSETEERLRKLKKLEKKEEEEAARERYEEEQILKEARKAKKKKEEEEMLKQAIKEHELKVLEEKAKAEKKKKEEDEAFRERTIKTFAAAGYSEGSIEKLLKKAEGKGKEKKGEKQIMDLTRPTYIKVHRKHLSPDTLDEYDLPWEWDDRDSSYLIIKRWIPEREQDILFEHTRKLRERKLLTDTTVELKKERDQLVLIRRKSPGRARSKSRPKSWLFGGS